MNKPLLNGDVSEELGIVKRADIDNIRSNSKISFDPYYDYPKLFEGLSNVKVLNKIRLTPQTVPFALTKPRQIPIPMLKEIKDNLDNIVNLKVIEPVEEPTDWCAGLVLAPKANGNIMPCLFLIHVH